MKTCEHDIEVGKFCAKCAAKPKIPYVYSREQVIALNPIRKAQGLPPLTGNETYESQGLVYCPCSGQCHRSKSPCSLTCAGHDIRGLK
jgi:hypothetical protein